MLVRSKTSLRWMMVDSLNTTPNLGRPYIWSGRWAFGGQWTIHVEHHDDTLYTVKDRRDARRDAERLRAARA